MRNWGKTGSCASPSCDCRPINKGLTGSDKQAYLAFLPTFPFKTLEILLTSDNKKLHVPTTTASSEQVQSTLLLHLQIFALSSQPRAKDPVTRCLTSSPQSPTCSQEFTRSSLHSSLPSTASFLLSYRQSSPFSLRSSTSSSNWFPTSSISREGSSASYSVSSAKGAAWRRCASGARIASEEWKGSGTDYFSGNIVMLAVVGGLVYGYLNYQRKQGRPVVVGGKKLN